MTVEKLINKYKSPIENGYMALEIIDFKTKEELYIEDCMNVVLQLVSLEKLMNYKVKKVRFNPDYYLQSYINKVALIIEVGDF